MDLQNVGRVIIVLGIAALLVGGLLILVGGSDTVRRWLEAGTLRVQGNGISCVVPILASIILSILGTIVLNIVIRLLNK